MAYSQLQKLETKVHIEASAREFHDVLCNKTHHIANICPEIVVAVKLQKGEWGREGSIQSWDYVHEGEVDVIKNVVEGIERENNKVSFKAIEGNLLEYYKSFKSTLQVTTKERGSEVHWVLEYEKQNHNPDPSSYLKMANEITKAIDAHLTPNKN